MPSAAERGTAARLSRTWAVGDGLRLADRGQVDRRGPRQQQPDVSVDRRPRGRRELEPEAAQAVVDDGVIGRREGRECP